MFANPTRDLTLLSVRKISLSDLLLFENNCLTTFGPNSIFIDNKQNSNGNFCFKYDDEDGEDERREKKNMQH